MKLPQTDTILAALSALTVSAASAFAFLPLQETSEVSQKFSPSPVPELKSRSSSVAPHDIVRIAQSLGRSKPQAEAIAHVDAKPPPRELPDAAVIRRLNLRGVVLMRDTKQAIFEHPGQEEPIALRVGEEYASWYLRALGRDFAVFEADGNREILKLWPD